MANLETRLSAAVDQALDGGIAGGKVVGAVVKIVHGGAPVYTQAAGWADREAGIRLKDDAIFRLASMSKPIVSATALALVERGKLHLDDPVTAWLPAFRPKLGDGSEPAILIRHLLTHTSGLTYGFVERPGHSYHRANVSDGLDQPGLSMEENLRRIASVPLNFGPGTGWNYSVSIDVLGAVIAAATGGTLAEAVASLVTRPLGMTETGFHLADINRLAPVYADGDPRPTLMTDPQRVRRPEDPETHLIFSPSRVFDAASFQSGGAGMNGTAADYLRFVEALRRGGTPILKPDTVALATRNQIGTLPRDPRDAGRRSGFFGNLVEDPVAAMTPQSPGTLTFGGAWGHSGFLDRERGLSVVILTNTAVEGVAGTFPITIRDAIYSALNG
jgi:CubicO group peptidase (beta-lactamase class C family)